MPATENIVKVTKPIEYGILDSNVCPRFLRTIRTSDVQTMYLLGCVHAITSGVIIFRQTDHHRERCARYARVIVLPLYSAHPFLQEQRHVVR